MGVVPSSEDYLDMYIKWRNSVLRTRLYCSTAGVIVAFSWSNESEGGAGVESQAEPQEISNEQP